MTKLDFNLNPPVNYDSKALFEELFGKKSTPTTGHDKIAKTIKKEFCEISGYKDVWFGVEYVWLLIKLKALGFCKFAVSKKESVKLKEAFGLCKIEPYYIEVCKNGKLDISSLNLAKQSGCDVFFVSPADYDLFVVEDLREIKQATGGALLVGDGSLLFDKSLDICLLQADRLGAISSAIAHNGILGEQNIADVNIFGIATLVQSLKNKRPSKENGKTKEYLCAALKQEFQDDILFFVEPSLTLDNSLHIALRGIKAGEFVKIAAMDAIYLTNGEACNMLLKKPSLVLQSMGYSEEEARWCISMSFDSLTSKEIDEAVKTLKLRYRQHISVIN